MKLRVFAVYDDKAGAYMTPFFMPSVGEAVRAFSDAVVNPESAFHRHADDFTLYELGEYDQALGRFVCDVPEPLVRASSLIVPSGPKRLEA